MNLHGNFKRCAHESMKEFVDQNNIVLEDYDKWFTMFENEQWWEFDLHSLTLYDFNELLETNKEFQTDFEYNDPPDDIATLMIRYGSYWSHQYDDDFRAYWKELVTNSHNSHL